MTLQDRARGCLLGLACGDAVGTTVEFMPRGSFTPVTDMVGGGPFGLPVGAWTDDTSMVLCLAESLIETKRFDVRDQMERYVRWMSKGHLSSTGRCFDIGMTVSRALHTFINSDNPFAGPTHSQSAGNGCIMRLAPVPIRYHNDCAQAIELAGESSRTTHGAHECIEASKLYAAILHHTLHGNTKDDILLHHGHTVTNSEIIQDIANGDYRTKTEDEIVGSGYVVNCLEAALWSFHVTDNFRDAILKATNLGDDADTTAAVTGQIAGAFYGEEGIPNHWRSQLVMVDTIRDMADALIA